MFRLPCAVLILLLLIAQGALAEDEQSLTTLEGRISQVRLLFKSRTSHPEPKPRLNGTRFAPWLSSMTRRQQSSQRAQMGELPIWIGSDHRQSTFLYTSKADKGAVQLPKDILSALTRRLLLLEDMQSNTLCWRDQTDLTYKCHCHPSQLERMPSVLVWVEQSDRELTIKITPKDYLVEPVVDVNSYATECRVAFESRPEPGRVDIAEEMYMRTMRSTEEQTGTQELSIFLPQNANPRARLAHALEYTFCIVVFLQVTLMYLLNLRKKRMEKAMREQEIEEKKKLELEREIRSRFSRSFTRKESQSFNLTRNSWKSSQSRPETTQKKKARRQSTQVDQIAGLNKLEAFQMADRKNRSDTILLKPQKSVIQDDDTPEEFQETGDKNESNSSDAPFVMANTQTGIQADDSDSDDSKSQPVDEDSHYF